MRDMRSDIEVATAEMEAPGLQVFWIGRFAQGAHAGMHPKSMGWTLKPHIYARRTLKGLIRVVESVRNSYVKLCRNLLLWLCERILLEEELDFDRWAADQWWVLVGISPKLG